ncbi:MAG: hypothetical protein K8S25_12215, partial [Alphaproteobacteria bacterium]|nr:hypothetical protein [Alphaproteobacteria bacterium]
MQRGQVIGFFVLLMFWAGAGSATAAPKLAAPPRAAETWVIISMGAELGWSKRWSDKDGRRWSRETYTQYGAATDIEQQIVLGSKGELQSFDARGSLAGADTLENFSVTQGAFVFSSPIDAGAGEMRENLSYIAYGGTLDSRILLFDAARRAPAMAVDLVPSGRMQLERLTSAPFSNGRTVRTLTA